MGPAELATLWEEISVELSDTLVGELAPNDNDDTNPIDMKINVDDDQSQSVFLTWTAPFLHFKKLNRFLLIVLNPKLFFYKER